MHMARLTRMLSSQNLINLKYYELGSKTNLSEKLYQAFGKEGFGVLTVSDVPRLASVKNKLYQQSFKLSQLPQAEKIKLLSPGSGYKIGWNEQKSPFGEIQASFTANPQEDIFGSPPFSNLWPSNFPYFRSNFRELGQILISTAIQLSTHIDHFLDMHFPYSQLPRFESTISSSQSHLGTLCHSLPFFNSSTNSSPKSWEVPPNIFSIFIAPVYHQQLVTSCEEIEQVLLMRGNNEEKNVALNNDSVCFVIGKNAEVMSDEIFEAKQYVEVYNERNKGMIKTNYFVQAVEDEARIDCNKNERVVGRVFARVN